MGIYDLDRASTTSDTGVSDPFGVFCGIFQSGYINPGHASHDGSGNGTHGACGIYYIGQADYTEAYININASAHFGVLRC